MASSGHAKSRKSQRANRSASSSSMLICISMDERFFNLSSPLLSFVVAAHLLTQLDSTGQSKSCEPDTGNAISNTPPLEWLRLSLLLPLR